MTTSSGWSNIFGAAALLACSTAAHADLTFSLDPPAVPAGERATLTIRLPEKDLQRPPGVDPDEAPEAKDDLFMQAPGLLVLDHDLKKENGVYVWSYVVTGYFPGKVSLPPIEIRLGPQTFSSTAVPLQITTGRAEGDEELRPELGEVPFPFPWLRNLTILGLAAGLYYGYKRWRRWRDTQPPVLVPLKKAGPPPERPDAWLRKRFAEIRARLERGEAQGTVDDLTSALRGYYERVKAEPVTAWTTREFGQTLGQDAHALLLIPIFERTDRFKFSGEKTATEVVAEISLAESERILAP